MLVGLARVPEVGLPGRFVTLIDVSFKVRETDVLVSAAGGTLPAWYSGVSDIQFFWAGDRTASPCGPAESLTSQRGSEGGPSGLAASARG